MLYMFWNQVHDQLLHCLFRTWGNTATNHKAGKSLRWKATGNGRLWQFVILEATMQSFHTLGAVTHNTYSPRSTFSWNPNWGAVSKKMAQTMGLDYVSLRPLPFHPESQRNQQGGMYGQRGGVKPNFWCDYCWRFVRVCTWDEPKTHRLWSDASCALWSCPPSPSTTLSGDKGRRLREGSSGF